MKQVGNLVRDGFADWRSLSDGSIELRLGTGEIYHLGVDVITRMN
jgi:hypothetical protein